MDYHVLASVFTHWAQLQHEVDTGKWFAVDGKSIKGSVTNYDQAQQNFVSMVSMFSHQRGVVQAVMPMEQKLVSEQEVVRVLPGAVGLSGIGVTLDALHCQKNTAPDCGARQRLPRVCQSKSAALVPRHRATIEDESAVKLLSGTRTSSWTEHELDSQRV